MDIPTQNQADERVLFKVIKGAEDFQAGNSVQVTRFLPLLRFGERDRGPAFFKALLWKVRKETIQTAHSPLIPLQYKLALLEQSIELLSGDLDIPGGRWTVALREQAEDLIERLHALQPGWKRVSIHAKRRRAGDKDLLLAEYILRGYLPGVVELFLSTYVGYRYHLLPDADQRVLWMVDFWSKELFRESVESFTERMRLNPPLQKKPNFRSPWEQRMARAQNQRSVRKRCEKPAAADDAALPSPTVKPYTRYVLDDAVVARLNALEVALGENDHDHDDPVVINLGRAHYNLVQAWRGFCDRGELSGVATRLKGAKNRCCEVWLYRNGHIQNIAGDRSSMKSLFCSLAPPVLLRKELTLEEKLTCLFYGAIYTDQAFLGIELPDSERRPEIAACLAETLSFYEHFLNGAPFPKFRWERDVDYRPGQYVWRLERMHHSDFKTGDLVNFWRALPWLVVDVADRSVVIRSWDCRRMERCDTASIFLLPTDRHDDLTAACEQRALWFDLRPQLRQVPFYMPNFLAIGQSFEHSLDFDAALYRTCRCCGYPTRLSETAALALGTLTSEWESWCPICGWYGDDCSTNGRNKINYGYTLAEARENFEALEVIFRPQDGEDYRRHQLAAVKKVKASLCTAFDAMVGERNQGRLFLLWWQAEKFKQDLQRVLFQLDGFENHETYVIEPGTWIKDRIDGESLVVGIYRGFNSIILRFRNGRGKNREIVLEYGRELLPRPRINIRTPFYARRTWFEYAPEYLRGYVPCPCCGYPTLKIRGGGECCTICRWHDTGQDDHDADQVSDGRNGDLTLTQARQNFSESPPEPDKQRLLSLYERLITVENAEMAEELWDEIEIIRRDGQGWPMA